MSVRLKINEGMKEKVEGTVSYGAQLQHCLI